VPWLNNVTGKKEKETQIKRLSLSTSPPYYKGKRRWKTKLNANEREREREKERERESKCWVNENQRNVRTFIYIFSRVSKFIPIMKKKYI